MKLIAINGSPRKNWNTDSLLKEVIDGASSAGAETEMIYLYNLDFKGCKGCMACKIKNGKSLGRCNKKDDLKEVLDKVHEADVLVLGSPIYWHDVTGVMRCFIERLFFQYLNYDDHDSPLSTPKRTAMIYTMNMPSELHEENKYETLIFKKYENLMKEFFGHCETLYTTQTLFVKNYEKYHLGVFDEEFMKERHETHFSKITEKAYELGVNLIEMSDRK
ncbi:MAG: flavodoxin family protein [Methanobrevibacter sp.]|uniref:flavodoxin family protein n=1 Tax=Methanobrevibacter sp. TaxID=66852 RepID=UPI0025FAE217|nr:flavodoxin family protein [Methanobrevibacter sp.]MBR0271231.1 flavodoxin family protein [Methanobrevibacter sp.]